MRRRRDRESAHVTRRSLRGKRIVRTGIALNADVTLPLKCSFDPEDWHILARHWYPIALADEVGHAPHKAMLLDEPLVAYRVKGNLVVARDVCPHRGVPLTLGRHDGEGIVCRYHGLRYGIEGRCKSNTGEPKPAHSDHAETDHVSGDRTLRGRASFPQAP